MQYDTTQCTDILYNLYKDHDGICFAVTKKQKSVVYSEVKAKMLYYISRSKTHCKTLLMQPEFSLCNNWCF